MRRIDPYRVIGVAVSGTVILAFWLGLATLIYNLVLR